MRDLAILIFLTTDGVMQGPSSPNEDRSGGFERGGWAAPFWDEVMEVVGREALSTPYDLLLGRKTYDLFAEHHPAEGDASPLNRMTKVVVTSSPGNLPWGPARAITGDLPTEIAKLKSEEGPLLQVHGSWQLNQALLAHDLVDIFRLVTFPVCVGAGRRLFREGVAPATLELVKIETTPAGALYSEYRKRT